jgi:hypothetical protein
MTPTTPREAALLNLLAKIHANFKRGKAAGKYQAFNNLDNYHNTLEAEVKKAVEG